MYDVVDAPVVVDRGVDYGRRAADPWAGLDAEGAYRQAVRDALAVCLETAARYGALPQAGIAAAAREIGRLVP